MAGLRRPTLRHTLPLHKSGWAYTHGGDASELRRCGRSERIPLVVVGTVLLPSLRGNTSFEVNMSAFYFAAIGSEIDVYFGWTLMK